MRERGGILSFNKGEDRISKYLSMLNQGMLFNELDDNYLEATGLNDILKDVPVPICINKNGEMTTADIVLNMARIIGGDTNFRYKNQYLEYIKRIAGEKATLMLTTEGAKSADIGNYELACMYFRAALLIEPTARDPLYLYGRACKGCYEAGNEEEEYVGRFKAESTEAFEILTIMHPKFSMGYYFLGYAYLNLGLYMKAKLTWEEFLKYIEEELYDRQEDEIAELKKDILRRLEDLEEPIIIENGCNLIITGEFQKGIDILQKFCKGKHENWWPLWYYLGVAELSLGNHTVAEKHFKKALKFSPSNIKIMQELIGIYTYLKDRRNIEKYTKKIHIVRKNLKDETCDKI